MISNLGQNGSGNRRIADVGLFSHAQGIPEHLRDLDHTGAAAREVGGKRVAQRIPTLLINSLRRGSLTGSIRFLAVKFR